MKTLNLLFSILFVIWCGIILVIRNSDSTFKNLFYHGMNEKLFNFFWELIILASFFNILARIFNQCNFYLIGAFGLIILALIQTIDTVFFFNNYIIGFMNRKERDAHRDRFILIVLTFPYIIFGILSSICCYQTKIHQRIDRTQSKLQQFFLQKIPLTNYQLIILIFYLLISASSVVLLIIVIIESGKFEYGYLALLFPIIPTFAYFLTMEWKKKAFYICVLFFWGLFGLCSAALSVTVVIYVHHEKHKLFEMVELFSVSLIFVIHGVIGYFSTLSIYRKNQKKEYLLKFNFENANFIALEDLNINHQIEQQPLVHLYPDIADI